MSEFRYISPAQEVIFGPGSLAKLGGAVQRFGWKRVLLCTNRTLRQNGSAAAAEAALGSCLAGVYDQVHPHVQDGQVNEILETAASQEVDALVALGGGSPIGIAKAVSFVLEGQITGNNAHSDNPTAQPRIPVAAVPTTYAGSEMTSVFGITHHEGGKARKVTVTDPKVAPKLVLYDPLLTLDLPPEMTASTGINALAHCIEAVYSITRHPLSSAAALDGLRRIARSLLRCYQAGEDREARTDMLIGAHLAGVALSSVTMGLHHGLCHVLGGTAGIPHGIANSIILPHAMRFNLDKTALELAQAAEAMGIPVGGLSDEEAGEAAVQAVYSLIGEMKLPQHLREVGISKEDLPGLARAAMESRAVRSNPKTISDASQIEAMLDEAW